MWVSTNLFFTHNIINFLCKRIQWTKTFLAKYKKIERQSFVNSCGILYFFSKKKKRFWFEFCHWLEQRLYLHKVWIIKTMVDQCSDYFDSCIVVCLITTSQNCQQEYSRRYIQNKASFVMERGKLTSWKRALCSNQSQPLLIALPWYTRYIIMA